MQDEHAYLGMRPHTGVPPLKKKDYDTIEEFSRLFHIKMNELIESFIDMEYKNFRTFKILWTEQRFQSLYHIDFATFTRHEIIYVMLREALGSLLQSISLHRWSTMEPSHSKVSVMWRIAGHVYFLYTVHACQLGNIKQKIMLDPDSAIQLALLSSIILEWRETHAQCAKEVNAMLSTLVRGHAFCKCVKGYTFLHHEIPPLSVPDVPEYEPSEFQPLSIDTAALQDMHSKYMMAMQLFRPVMSAPGRKNGPPVIRLLNMPSISNQQKSANFIQDLKAILESRSNTGDATNLENDLCAILEADLEEELLEVSNEVDAEESTLPTDTAAPESHEKTSIKESQSNYLVELSLSSSTESDVEVVTSTPGKAVSLELSLSSSSESDVDSALEAEIEEELSNLAGTRLSNDKLPPSSLSCKAQDTVFESRKSLSQNQDVHYREENPPHVNLSLSSSAESDIDEEFELELHGMNVTKKDDKETRKTLVDESQPIPLPIHFQQHSAMKSHLSLPSTGGHESEVVHTQTEQNLSSIMSENVSSDEDLTLLEAEISTSVSVERIKSPQHLPVRLHAPMHQPAQARPLTAGMHAIQQRAISTDIVIETTSKNNQVNPTSIAKTQEEKPTPWPRKVSSIQSTRSLARIRAREILKAPQQGLQSNVSAQIKTPLSHSIPPQTSIWRPDEVLSITPDTTVPSTAAPKKMASIEIPNAMQLPQVTNPAAIKPAATLNNVELSLSSSDDDEEKALQQPASDTSAPSTALPKKIASMEIPSVTQVLQVTKPKATLNNVELSLSSSDDDEEIAPQLPTPTPTTVVAKKHPLESASEDELTALEAELGEYVEKKFTPPYRSVPVQIVQDIKVPSAKSQMNLVVPLPSKETHKRLQENIASIDSNVSQPSRELPPSKKRVKTTQLKPSQFGATSNNYVTNLAKRQSDGDGGGMPKGTKKKINTVVVPNPVVHPVGRDSDDSDGLAKLEFELGLTSSEVSKPTMKKPPPQRKPRQQVKKAPRKRLVSLSDASDPELMALEAELGIQSTRQPSSKTQSKPPTKKTTKKRTIKKREIPIVHSDDSDGLAYLEAELGILDTKSKQPTTSSNSLDPNTSESMKISNNMKKSTKPQRNKRVQPDNTIKQSKKKSKTREFHVNYSSDDSGLAALDRELDF